MTEFLEILKYTLPAVIVLLCAVLLIKYFLKAESEKSRIASKGKISEKTIQIRLQAYERIVLLLERISPQQLVLRIDSSEMDTNQYQRHLLRTVREEFEHNLAQQIYVSVEAWEMVKSAKETVIQMINKSAKDIPADATALSVASKLVELNMLDGNKQIDKAISFVKKEVMELF